MPLYLFKMEYSLEGVWAAAEIIFSSMQRRGRVKREGIGWKICGCHDANKSIEMMSYITLDHLFLNLQKKCTPQSYDNIVRVIHVCLPLEAEGNPLFLLLFFNFPSSPLFSFLHAYN